MKRISPTATMIRSSVTTGRPFTPLLAADKVSFNATTMRSRPAAPVAQPPGAAVVLARAVASVRAGGAAADRGVGVGAVDGLGQRASGAGGDGECLGWDRGKNGQQGCRQHP